MSQPTGDCDTCGCWAHLVEGLCPNCRHAASWPHSSGACPQMNPESPVYKRQPGEMPGALPADHELWILGHD